MTPCSSQERPLGAKLFVTDRKSIAQGALLQKRMADTVPKAFGGKQALSRRRMPQPRAASPPGCARRRASVVAHDDTLMRIAVRPCQTVTPHQQVPSRLQRRDHALRRVGVAERHQHLVQHHLVQHLEAGVAQALGEAPRLAAVALDQLRDAARGPASAAPPRPRRRARGATARACSRTDCGLRIRSAGRRR